VKLVVEAIRRARSTDRRRIRDELARIRRLPTVLGEFSFDEERNPRYEPLVQVVRDGRRVRPR
jgi:branched-chain amino acid transport system substrate-binding protein